MPVGDTLISYTPSFLKKPRKQRLISTKLNNILHVVEGRVVFGVHKVPAHQNHFPMRVHDEGNIAPPSSTTEIKGKMVVTITGLGYRILTKSGHEDKGHNKVNSYSVPSYFTHNSGWCVIGIYHTKGCQIEHPLGIWNRDTWNKSRRSPW